LRLYYGIKEGRRLTRLKTDPLLYIPFKKKGKEGGDGRILIKRVGESKKDVKELDPYRNTSISKGRRRYTSRRRKTRENHVDKGGGKMSITIGGAKGEIFAEGKKPHKALYLYETLARMVAKKDSGIKNSWSQIQEGLTVSLSLERETQDLTSSL